MSLFLNWFDRITDTMHTPPLLTVQAAPHWALSDSDSEAARVRLQLLAPALSLLGGEEFISFFGTLDGFLAVCNNRV